MSSLPFISCIPHAHLLVCIGLPPNPPAKPKHAAAAATGGEKHGNEVLGSPASCAAEHAGFSPPLKTLHSPGNGPLKQSVFVSKGSAKNVCTLMPPTNCKERKQWRTSQAASAMPMEMLAILYHALCVICNEPDATCSICGEAHHRDCGTAKGILHHMQCIPWKSLAVLGGNFIGLFQHGLTGLCLYC